MRECICSYELIGSGTEIARKQMVQPLIDAKVKFNEKDVLFVVKDQTGQVVWLEAGNEKLFSKNGNYYIVSGIGKNGFIVSVYLVNEKTANALIGRNKK